MRREVVRLGNLKVIIIVKEENRTFDNYLYLWHLSALIRTMTESIIDLYITKL